MLVFYLFFFSAAFKVTCIKLDSSLLPLFVSKWFCDEIFFPHSTSESLQGCSYWRKKSGTEKAKNFLPFWRQVLPVCSIQIIKAKKNFLHVWSFVCCMIFYILHDVFSFTGADKKGVIQREKFLTENSSYI